MSLRQNQSFSQLIIGPHVNRSKEKTSITKCIKNAIIDCRVHSINMTIASIFVSNPRGLQIILKDAELDELKQYIKTKQNFLVIAHSSYVAFLWNKENPDKYIDFVKKEYILCKDCGISGLVVHLPKESILKQKRIKETIKKLIDKLDNTLINDTSISDKSINDNPIDDTLIVKPIDKTIEAWSIRQDISENTQKSNCPIIYFETPAIVPMWASYDTPEKLSKLFYIINKINPNHPFGLCIDTAHIWTSGNDISSYNNARRWFSELMESPYIPHDRIIIHLNDSANELGHGPDKHASLTNGYIWNNYKTRGELKKSGIYFIIEFANQYNIPIILERNNNESLVQDYKILSKII
jgi:endonuclease IV